MSQTQSRSQMTAKRLEEFGNAWARGDIDTLMTFITPDCVYQASVGPEPGETFSGAAEVRRGFLKLLGHDAAAEVRSGRIFVSGDTGVAEWSLILKEANAEREVRGCDLFTFEGDCIKRKDAFRKVFG